MTALIFKNIFINEIPKIHLWYFFLILQCCCTKIQPNISQFFFFRIDLRFDIYCLLLNYFYKCRHNHCHIDCTCYALVPNLNLKNVVFLNNRTTGFNGHLSLKDFALAKSEDKANSKKVHLNIPWQELPNHHLLKHGTTFQKNDAQRIFINYLNWMFVDGK